MTRDSTLDREKFRSPRGSEHEELTEARPQTSRHAHVRVEWEDSAGSHRANVVSRCVLGSSSQASLVVAERAVSRFHAEFEPRSDGMWIRDLGSRNGTYVNGVCTSLARLPAAGTVHVGNTSLRFEEDGHGEVPLWPRSNFGSLYGASQPMRDLFNQLARVAASDAPVLILGETGTGKELVAREIHEASPRSGKPFVIVDCAALPELLLEAELFGHTRGAFTGAVRAREGAFEAADGGTLFLDEIGELSISVQPKLLRALEARAIRRVGENDYRNVDVRIVTATHRDLRAMVNARTFREDLYFRLAVLPLCLPALRDRGDDVLLLAERFASDPGFVTPEIRRQLESRSWDGNVRELRNFVERCRTLGPGETWGTDQPSSRSLSAELSRPGGLPGIDHPAVDDTTSFKEFRDKWIAYGERKYLEQLLARTGDNVAAAATAASLERTYMYRLLRKHGL